MESGAKLSAPMYTSTVRVADERWAAKKQMNHWRTEASWPSLKEDLVNSTYPSLRGKCDEACLELGFDTASKQTLFNILRRIGRKLITYENAFPIKNMSLISEN